MTTPNLENRISELEKLVAAIQERNRRVEKDKAWETSTFRIITVAIITYFVMCLIFYFLGIDKFLFNAIIPTLGFVLSTQSLSFIKNWWTAKNAR